MQTVVIRQSFPSASCSLACQESKELRKWNIQHTQRMYTCWLREADDGIRPYKLHVQSHQLNAANKKSAELQHRNIHTDVAASCQILLDDYNTSVVIAVC